MENINRQMQASGFGVAVKASGPDTNYGLGQCYEDLSLLDCMRNARLFPNAILTIQVASTSMVAS